MGKPRLLDLYSCAGGAAMGYHRAGFDVVGVDNRPQPRYPFEFHQADALDFLAAHGHEFDAIHASPPCHDHTSLKARSGEDGTGWLLDATRLALADHPVTVIENVAGADMRVDLRLCGGMFDLRTYRHRWFEITGPLLLVEPAHPAHRARTATRKRKACWDTGMHVSVTGDVGTYIGPEALGIDWMNGDELSQAIPPAYTEFIGRQLVDHLEHTHPRLEVTATCGR
jgi:DNA (cytosine-5)-methyltransferase 1